MHFQASLLLAASLHLPGDQVGDLVTAPAGGEAVPGPGSTTEVYDGRAGRLEVAARRVEEARIGVDGRLQEEAWAAASLLDGFTQYDPVEGIPASQRTEVRVLVAGDALYFGIRAHDDLPGGVRATLAKRDGFGSSDDWVRVLLDTFNDQRRAFVFQVNPLGVQGDGLWVEGRGGRMGEPIDWNPDFYWESAGEVDGSGYTVELRIPLKSLRFPATPEQEWGLQVVRQVQRNGYSESWAPLTAELANRLAQSGKLRGLRGLEQGRVLELNPVLTASRQGSWDAASASLAHGPATGDFGFNVAYGLTSNLMLDATYNPDFSQVEADAGQIAVNERFALFFPEKRPFFLEGTDAFSMPRQLVYTRTIGNPVGAAKLAGKAGGFSVAYVGAVDEVHGGGDHPMVNLLRVRRDVGSGSSLGMVYTDRTLSGQQFNRVVGADGRFVLAQRYTVEVMAAGSADRRPGAATDYGSLVLASLSRASRSLTLSASFEDATRDFQARSGFIREVGITQGEARAGYSFRGAPGALVERWGPNVSVESTWDRSDFWSGGGPRELELQVGLSASLRGNLGGFLSYTRSSFAFGPEWYQGLFLQGVAGEPPLPFAPDRALFGGLNRVSLRAWLSRWERARLSLGGGWGETPIFSSGAPADLAESLSADVGLTLYPTGSLSVEAGLRHSSIFRQRDRSRYSSATIPRLQARYQFSRALFVRGVGEYSSQSRGDLLDPQWGAPVLACVDSTCSPRVGSDTHDLRLEGLLGYEPSPGTVVYLGYTRQMRDAEAFGFREVTTRADGLFVKLSYKLRW